MSVPTMKNVIVLGSGRSGTSMVAGMLAKAGYYFGENLGLPQPANPKGYFESIEINRLNESLIERVPHIPVRRKRFVWPGTRKNFTELNHLWLAQVEPGVLFPVDESFREAVAALVRRQPYCYKDPRICYTLPAWWPFLENTACVCVFREPNTTAESMLHDCRTSPYYWDVHLTYHRALAVWECMYTHVLEAHCHRGDWLFLHYDQVLRGAATERFEAHVGARIDADFADPCLKRTVPRRRVPASAAALYRRLCARAGFDEGEA